MGAGGATGGRRGGFGGGGPEGRWRGGGRHAGKGKEWWKSELWVGVILEALGLMAVSSTSSLVENCSGDEQGRSFAPIFCTVVLRCGHAVTRLFCTSGIRQVLRVLFSRFLENLRGMRTDGNRGQGLGMQPSGRGAGNRYWSKQAQSPALHADAPGHQIGTAGLAAEDVVRHPLELGEAPGEPAERSSAPGAGGHFR